MGLTPWKTGDDISAAHLQEAVSRLNDIQKFNNGGASVIVPGIENAFGRGIVRIWLMQIVAAGPDGQGDPSDCTYWCKKQMCINDFSEDGNDEAELNLDDEVLPEENPLIVKATNLPEYVSETHSVATDGSRYVVVFEIHARQNSTSSMPFVKYFFSEGDPPSSTTLAKVTEIVPSDDGSSPILYTVRTGHRQHPTSTSLGSWSDDGGGDAQAYMLDPAMIPVAPNSIVTIGSPQAGFGDSEGTTFYSIFGSFGTFRVWVKKNAGDDGNDGQDGNAKAFATFTYDVFLDSAMTQQIGTDIAVAFHRMVPIALNPGSDSPSSSSSSGDPPGGNASMGLAQMSAVGAVILLMVDEFLDDDDCHCTG